VLGSWRKWCALLCVCNFVPHVDGWHGRQMATLCQGLLVSFLARLASACGCCGISIAGTCLGWLVHMSCAGRAGLKAQHLHRCTATGMDGYKMDGKSLVVRIAGQKDNRGPRGSYGGVGHDHGHGDDRIGALRGPHGTMHPGGSGAPPPPPGACACAAC
jgi:hypothetical protein